MTAAHLAIGFAGGFTFAYALAAGDLKRGVEAREIVRGLAGAALGAALGAGFCVLLFGIAPA